MTVATVRGIASYSARENVPTGVSGFFFRCTLNKLSGLVWYDVKL